jgi:hypothetical protein
MQINERYYIRCTFGLLFCFLAHLH